MLLLFRLNTVALIIPRIFLLITRSRWNQNRSEHSVWDRIYTESRRQLHRWFVVLVLLGERQFSPDEPADVLDCLLKCV